MPSSELIGEFTRYVVGAGTQRVTTDQPHLVGMARIADGAAVAGDQLRVLH